MSCLQSLDCGTQREHSLSEFAAKYLVDVDALLTQTCAVVRRHRHTLRRLKVPILRLDGVPVFADALAECTAITSLDLSFRTFPFRSWQQLGQTLHTLKLTQVRPDATAATFRLLADNMTALRKLEYLTLGQQPSQDGFIELVSRLRSLTVLAKESWASVSDPDAWPLTLPNLEEVEWCTDDGVDPVAVAVVRRAVALRAAHVSHASALAAIAAGPVAGVGSTGDPRTYAPLAKYAPLANVQPLTLSAVATDAASLSTTLAATPRVSFSCFGSSRLTLFC
jgi:hypothetical protein